MLINALIEVGSLFKSSRLGLWCRPAQASPNLCHEYQCSTKVSVSLRIFFCSRGRVCGRGLPAGGGGADGVFLGHISIFFKCSGGGVPLLNAYRGNTESRFSKPRSLRENKVSFSYPGCTVVYMPIGV